MPLEFVAQAWRPTGGPDVNLAHSRVIKGMHNLVHAGDVWGSRAETCEPQDVVTGHNPRTKREESIALKYRTRTKRWKEEPRGRSRERKDERKPKE